MIQLIKFACVGIANTLVDLGVLNLLLAGFNLHGNGFGYIACKAASFSVAVVNSYILNRHWVFKEASNDPGRLQGRTRMTAFAAVSGVGLVVNTAVSGASLVALSSLFPHALPTVTANSAAIIGTIAVLAFNFFGYKRLVFRPVALPS